MARTPVDPIIFGSRSVGLDLRERRTSAALRQVDVARQAGVRPETLNRVEHGHGNPTVGFIQKILIAIEHLSKRASKGR